MPPINDQHPPHPSSLKSPAHNPKFGQARCYWTLLTEALQFLYVDPIFRTHLGPQAQAIIGRSLLDFVHPDERTSAQLDLKKAIINNTLHGSVTRVRYTRLGRLRTSLGFTGVVATSLDEDRVSCDEDYITCDLVVNLAADNLVLCFIHASINTSPADNDEIYRTPWSNWCGTSEIDGEDFSRLSNVLSSISRSHPKTDSPIRIFQILKNTSDREILLSWPTNEYITQDEYRLLVNNVQIDGSNSSDAKTSCTRRFRALQRIPPIQNSIRQVESGLTLCELIEVESGFIPYEQIIFACHQLELLSRKNSQSSLSYKFSEDDYYSPVSTHQTDGISSSDSLEYPASHSSHIPRTDRLPPEESSSTPPPELARSFQSFDVDNSWQSMSSSQAAQTLSFSKRYISPDQRHTSIYADIIPLPRYRETRIHSEGVTESVRDAYNNATGSKGTPPAGIAGCAACKSVSSPEWRKGPSGKKDLCNACGLRYSRAKAKKEGITSRRRRDTRGLLEMDTMAIKGHPSDEKLANFSLHQTQQRLTTSALHSRDSAFETFHPHSHTISPPPSMYAYTMEPRSNPMQYYSYPTTSGIAYTHGHSTSYHHQTSGSSYHVSPTSGSSETGYMFHSVSSAAIPPSSYVRGLSSERRDSFHTESDHHYSLRR